MDKCTVTFIPHGKKIEVHKGVELLSAAVACGVYLNSSCGGDGVCGRCKVIVRKGDVRTEPSGRITPEERKKGYVLACLSTIHSDVEIEVPPDSRLEFAAITDEDARLHRLKGIYSTIEEVDRGFTLLEKDVFAHSPLATKLFLELPPPTLKDNVSDLERLYREIRKINPIPVMQTGLSNIKRLGHLFRQANWKVTVLLGKRNETTEIVLIEPGDTSNRNFGFAFDIGTTTVSGQLINLNTKEVLGTKSTHNQQIAFGSDVITRIIYASEKDGLERLHHAVVDNINDIIQVLISEHGINLSDVTAILCAGNMTMIHLLLRVDPTYIRREPYTPTANFVPVIRAAEAGIKINPRGLLSCVPGVSTYVGGDITAGVLSSGLNRQESLSILIDVGTNGEIVLGNREWMAACAASAGPAFEGSGLTCGMRAVSGAIQKVEIDVENDNVEVETIGNARPRGLCGSGLIDLLAEMVGHRIINRSGKLERNFKTRRMREGSFGPEFVLLFSGEKGAEKDIVINEADIDNLKRSKGAIYAATSILLRFMGLKWEDIVCYYIAGGFGTYLDIDKAITIGLLPDLPRDRFKFIGNSSLAGAREILLSYQAMREAEEIAKKITYFELSVEPSYMDEYIASLFFPHTDMERFPTQKRL